jgi:formylmethanofuran dehydrogenase subunit D
MKVKQMEYSVRGLIAGDVVQVVTTHGNTILSNAETDGDVHGIYQMQAAGFARIEILRSFLPGLPLLPALISNPIYFEP